MKISPLVDLQPQEWSGNTSYATLMELYDSSPQYLNNVIESMYNLNVSYDIVSKIESMPRETVKSPQQDFYWQLFDDSQRTTIVLGYYKDTAKSATPSKPGEGGSRFVIKFKDPIFKRTETIAPPDPEGHHLRIVEDKVRDGSGWLYVVEIMTGDENAFIDTDDLEDGTEWIKISAPVTDDMSDEGGQIDQSTYYRLRNHMTMVRLEAEIAGNMLSANDPLGFRFMAEDSSGAQKDIKSFIMKQEFEMVKQLRRNVALQIMYGHSNRKADGTYANFDKNTKVIKTGAGIYDQMTNKYSYNTFDFDKLIEMAMSLKVGKVAGDSFDLVLSCGEYGAKQFSDAARERSLEVVPYGNPGMIGVNSGGQGKHSLNEGMFSKVYVTNGISFTVMIDPYKDDPKLYRGSASGFGPGTPGSYIYDIFDFGSTNGDANIKLLEPENPRDKFQYGVINGLRSPYVNASNPMSGTPQSIASKVDGYELHMMKQFGAIIKNPINSTARYMPNIS